ncbi:hypothetical protein HY490_02550 [Candidatus Woesearchaeota archaeon]|nr:hypothetical protein [Candidatus Woesearchaeota archaeon]
MPTVADSVIRVLVDFGLVDVILPFVLVFAVVFGILEQTKVFGEQRKNVNIVVALVAAMLVLASVDVLSAVNRTASFLAVVLVTGLVVMMVLGVVGVQSFEKSKPLMYVVLAVMVLGGLYILGAFEIVNRRSLTNYFLPAVLVFALFVGLVWAVLRAWPKPKQEAKKATPKPGKKGKMSARVRWSMIPEDARREIIGELPPGEQQVFLAAARASQAIQQRAQQGGSDQPTPQEQKVFDLHDKLIEKIVKEFEL